MADVKWEIDIDAKADKAKTATSAVDRLEATLRKLDATVAGVGARFEDLGHKSEGFGTKANEVFKGMLGERLLEKIAEGAKAIVEHIAEIGKEAVKSAAAEQRMMRVFEAQAGSKELGEQNELWTDILSKQTEFNEQQTEGAFLDMKRVGASDQEAKLAIKAAADIAAVSKNKDEAFQATVEAFARLQRTGVISNRTLAPLGLGEKDFKKLDSMKGLSDKAVKKRMEEGKIDRGDLFKLIMSRANEKSIGERAANNADLLGTKFAKLTELPDKFYKKLADTTAIKTLTTSLDGVLEKLDPDSPTGKKISAFLEGAFTAAANAISKIDFDAMADTLTDDVLPAIKAMTEALVPTIEAIERVLRGLHSMKVAVFGMSLDDTPGIAAAHASRREKNRIEQQFGEKKTTLDSGAKAYHGAFHVMGEATGDGYIKGVEDSKAADAPEDMVDKGHKKAKKKLKIQSPSVVFEDIGAMTAAGFIQGVEGGHGDVDRSVGRMFDFGGGSGGGGGGGISVTIETNISLAHGDGAEQGKRAADAFNQQAEAIVISAIEKAAIQAGLL